MIQIIIQNKDEGTIKDFQILSYLNIIDYLMVNFIQKYNSNIFKLQQQKIRKLKIGLDKSITINLIKNRKDYTLKYDIYKNTDDLLFQVGETIGDFESTCYYKIKPTYILTLNNSKTRIKDIRTDLIIFLYLQNDHWKYFQGFNILCFSKHLFCFRSIAKIKTCLTYFRQVQAQHLISSQQLILHNSFDWSQKNQSIQSLSQYELWQNTMKNFQQIQSTQNANIAFTKKLKEANQINFQLKYIHHIEFENRPNVQEQIKKNTIILCLVDLDLIDSI
ncbi:unnamed protein product [Paramecium primaurelia]|uniref:Uncharacterized protein n=1 Tax=Paramecium primaurelia TaxID=5886 RepID=A0A8S1JXR4_PARPR|nr:unnamed protein product [Paramecium primaurelia]